MDCPSFSGWDGLDTDASGGELYHSRLERLDRRPTHGEDLLGKLKPHRLPHFGFLQKRVLRPGAYHDRPLGRPDDASFSLNKKDRWALADRLSDAAQGPASLDEDLVDLYVVVADLPPFTELQSLSRHGNAVRKLLVRRRNIDSEDDDVQIIEKRARRRYTRLEDLTEAPRPSRKSQSARERRGLSPEPAPPSLIGEAEPRAEEGELRLGFHFFHACQHQGLVSARAKKARSGSNRRTWDNESKLAVRRKDRRHLRYELEEELQGWHRRPECIDADLFFFAIEDEKNSCLTGDIPPTSRSLADFLAPSYPSKKKSTKKRTLDPSQLLPPEDWYYVGEEYLASSEPAPEAESPEPNWEAVSLPPFPSLPSHRFIVSEDELDAWTLEDVYGEGVWECGTWPRRVAVELSAAVRNVQRLAHGAAAEERDVRVHAVLALLPPSKASLRLADDRDEPCTFVDLRLSANLNQRANEVSLDMPGIAGTFASLSDILRTAAVQLGTLPLGIFDLQQNQPKSAKWTECGGGRMGVGKTRACPSASASSVLLSAAKAQQARRVAESDSGLESGISESEESETGTAAEPLMWATASGWERVPECGVCLESTESVAGLGGCGHGFCGECWEAHGRARLAAGSAAVPCMEAGCEEEADWAALSGLLPGTLLQRLEGLLSETFLLRNRGRFCFCPNEACSRLHESRSAVAGSGAACVCGRLWCRECEEAPHWPADCDLAARYREQLVLNGDDKPRSGDNERKVKVKKCPHCGTRMEKGAGCNHMSCRCGESFCWDCGRKWQSGRHYNCSANSAGGSGFETVFLQDVARSVRLPRGHLPGDAYKMAVAHRHAVYANRRLRAGLRRKLVVSAKASASLLSQGLSGRGLATELLRLSDALHGALEWWEVWRFARRLPSASPLRAQAETLAFWLRRIDDRLASLAIAAGDVEDLQAFRSRILHAMQRFESSLNAHLASLS